MTNSTAYRSRQFRNHYAESFAKCAGRDEPNFGIEMLGADFGKPVLKKRGNGLSK